MTTFKLLEAPSSCCRHSRYRLIYIINQTFTLTKGRPGALNDLDKILETRSQDLGLYSYFRISSE